MCLGRWVKKQRANKSTLPPERMTKLQSLKFEWDLQHPNDTRWENNFEALKTFHAENGHCHVPKDHVTDETGIKLGAWLAKLAMSKVRRCGQRIHTCTHTLIHM